MVSKGIIVGVGGVRSSEQSRKPVWADFPRMPGADTYANHLLYKLVQFRLPPGVYQRREQLQGKISSDWSKWLKSNRPDLDRSSNSEEYKKLENDFRANHLDAAELSRLEKQWQEGWGALLYEIDGGKKGDKDIKQPEIAKWLENKQDVYEKLGFEVPFKDVIRDLKANRF